MIPLDQVTVLGSNPRVLNFPAAARITNLGLMPGILHLEVEHATAWPMVPTSQDDAPSQTATLWVFLRIDGRWHATGAERLRPGQIAGEDKPEDANVNNFIAVSWLFDVSRWGPMAGYVPKDGEHVGVMVVAGSTRSDDTTPVEERTRVWELAWPGHGGAANIQPVWIEGEPDDEVHPLRPLLEDVKLAGILPRLDAIDRKLADLARQVEENTAQIQQLSVKP